MTLNHFDSKCFLLVKGCSYGIILYFGYIYNININELSVISIDWWLTHQVDWKKVFPVRIVKFVIVLSSSINIISSSWLTVTSVLDVNTRQLGDTAVTSRQVTHNCYVLNIGCYEITDLKNHFRSQSGIYFFWSSSYTQWQLPENWLFQIVLLILITLVIHI